MNHDFNGATTTRYSSIFNEMNGLFRWATTIAKVPENKLKTSYENNIVFW